MLRAKAFKLSSLCGVLHFALLSAACGSFPVSPTPLPATPLSVLTIAAKDARTGAALPDVRAYASNLRSCTTKDDGACRIDVDTGSTVTVAIWGDGYAGQVRTSTVSGASRWTFEMVPE